MRRIIRGYGGVTGFYRQGVGDNERGDSRGRSEALQMSPGGIHSASVRGEAFVRENGDLEKSLTSYLNN